MLTSEGYIEIGNPAADKERTISATVGGISVKAEGIVTLVPSEKWYAHSTNPLVTYHGLAYEWGDDTDAIWMVCQIMENSTGDKTTSLRASAGFDQKLSDRESLAYK